ncbi:hypothetical protein N665_0218s0105 [Sinapis alba]|nr:hypothetical protein N665_0218s0105 [Sinapis alba]
MSCTSTMAFVTPLNHTCLSTFFNPLPMKPSKAMSSLGGRTHRIQVRASKIKFGKAFTGLSAAALTALIMAEAAVPGIAHSLKNFLLSIASGGVVLTINIGDVVGVSSFDPVKRT